MKRLLLATALLLPAGCSSVPTGSNVATATTATISTAQKDVQIAIDAWGIAKGLASVAVPVLEASGNPAAVIAGQGISAAIAVVDPKVAAAQVALNAAVVDVQALEDLAAQIKAQATAVTVAAAPSITAVPAAASVAPVSALPATG